MRVGLLIYGDLEQLSGGYVYDRKLVDYLLAKGDEVEIVSLPARGYALNLLDNFSSGLRKRLLSLEVDVLVQDELNHPSLFWMNRTIKDQVNYPLVTIVHHLRCQEKNHPNILKGLYSRIEKAYLESLDAYVFVSENTRADVEALIGPRERFVLANPAGDRLEAVMPPEEIAERARQPGPLRIVFIGNLIWRKGLHFLFKALGKMPADSWRLTVVGSLEVNPGYAGDMRRWVGVEGWYEQVTFTGALNDQALVDRLAEAQVLAVPSSYEGYGIVYLEGMALGLPAIASTEGAAREIITHGADGFLVPLDNPASLAAHLTGLHQDRQRLAEMGAQARARFDAHPTWEDTASRFRAFLLSQT
ncbi:glycosyltransferase family 4 protein [Chloroflexota bacterium]